MLSNSGPSGKCRKLPSEAQEACLENLDTQVLITTNRVIVTDIQYTRGYTVKQFNQKRGGLFL